MYNSYYIYPYDKYKILDDIHSTGHYDLKTYMKILNKKSIKWTDGTIHPKMYGYVPKDSKKKRK